MPCRVFWHTAAIWPSLMIVSVTTSVKGPPSNNSITTCNEQKHCSYGGTNGCCSFQVNKLLFSLFSLYYSLPASTSTFDTFRLSTVVFSWFKIFLICEICMLWKTWMLVILMSMKIAFTRQIIYSYLKGANVCWLNEIRKYLTKSERV